MSRSRSAGLGTKLLISFPLIGLVPLLGVAALSYRNASTSLITQATRQFLSVRDLTKSRIKGYFSERYSDIQVLAENPLVTESLPLFAEAFQRGMNSENYRAVEARFGPLFSSYREKYGYYDIFLISATGDVVYTVAKEADLGTNLLVCFFPDRSPATGRGSGSLSRSGSLPPRRAALCPQPCG